MTVFEADESGLDESDLTSTLRVLLLDSDVEAGAGVACAGAEVAGAAAGADAAEGGACWHPVRVISPRAVTAAAVSSLQE